MSSLDLDHVVYKQNGTFNTFTLVFSSTGITLTALSIVLLILTAILFAEWRKSYKNQLLIQFMFARFLYTLVRYAYDVTTIFEVNQPSFYRDVNLILLFYTEMTLIAWMYVFSKQMYESFAKVFTVPKRRLIKVSVFAWFLPAFLTFLLYMLYAITDEQEKNIFIMYLAITKWPLLVCNAVLLILVLKAILVTNKSKTDKNVRIIMVMLLLIFSFCIQQILIDVYKLVIMVVFLNSDNSMPHYVTICVIAYNMLSLYYCGFSILFWVFGNERTRNLWKFRRNDVVVRSQSSLAPQMSLGTRYASKC